MEIMKPRQQKICELLVELKEICEKNNIEYYLAGNNAAYAYHFGYLPGGIKVGEIMIWPKDADKLAKAIEKENRSNRALEYLKNNADFPGFFMKYFALDTTQFEIAHEYGYKHFGMSVNIHFLCYVPANTELRNKLSVLNNGLVNRHGDPEFMEKKEIFSADFLKKWMKKHFWMNYSKLFDYFVKHYSKPTDKIACDTVVKPRFHFKATPEMMKGKGEIMIEEFSFAAPENVEAFVQGVFRRDYRIVITEGVKYPLMVTNSEIPYEDFFKAIGETPHELVDRIKVYDNKVRVNGGIIREKKDFLEKIRSIVYLMNNVLLLERIYTDEYVVRMKECYEHGDLENFLKMAEPYITFKEDVQKKDIVPDNNPVYDKLEAIFSDMGFLETVM